MTMTQERVRVALTNVHCRGRLPNGKPCDRLLFKIREPLVTELEIKCPKCGRIEAFGPVS